MAPFTRGEKRKRAKEEADLVAAARAVGVTHPPTGDLRDVLNGRATAIARMNGNPPPPDVIEMAMAHRLERRAERAEEERLASLRAARAAADDTAFLGVSADVVARSDRRHSDLDEIAAGRFPQLPPPAAAPAPEEGKMEYNEGLGAMTRRRTTENGERIVEILAQPPTTPPPAAAANTNPHADPSTVPTPPNLAASIRHAAALGETLSPSLLGRHRSTAAGVSRTSPRVQLHATAHEIDMLRDPVRDEDAAILMANLPDDELDDYDERKVAAQVVAQVPSIHQPFGLQAMADNVVASKTKKGYNGDAFHFLLWLYEKRDGLYLTEHCLSVFRSTTRQTGETPAKFRSRLSNAIKDLFAHCKSHPVIDLEALDAETFMTWLDSLYKKQDGRKLSASAYGSKRSMLHHLHILHTSRGVPERLEAPLKVLFAGFLRTLAKSRPADWKDAGKVPMSVELYKALSQWFLDWNTNAGIFAHCYLVLSWNLMCRSENTQNIHLSEMSWTSFDALEINFAHQKGDQKGDQAKYSRHLYANPYDHLVCPVNALALYFATLSKKQQSSNKLFPTGGDPNKESSQSTRFGELLAQCLDEHVGDLIAMGYPNTSDIGTHSIRKGAVTYVAGLPGGPSTTSICVRAGWTQGKVKDIYMKYMDSGDCFVGRCLTLLPLTSTQFAVSPVMFDHGVEGWDGGTVQRILRQQFPCLQDLNHFGKALPIMLGSLIYNRKELIDLGINHPIMQTYMFRDGDLLDYFDAKQDDFFYFNTFPWDYLDKSQAEGFTGVPPHIHLLHELILMRQQHSSMAKDFSGEVERIVDEKVAPGTGLTAKNVEEILEGPLKLLNEKLELLKPVTSPPAAAANNGNGAVAITQDDDDDDAPSHHNQAASSYRLHKHGEGFETHWEKLPVNWEVPRVAPKVLWKQWWIGNTHLGVPPLRFLCSEDLKFLNETPIAITKGRTGQHSKKKRPIRQTWSDIKAMMEWMQWQCVKVDALTTETEITKEKIEELYDSIIEPVMVAEKLIKGGNTRDVLWASVLRKMRAKDTNVIAKMRAETAMDAVAEVMDGPPAAEETLDDGDDGYEGA